MAEKLTPQQQQAVENRGGRLLVSAAAGSGKTKVLVDRLLGYLTDPVDPANLDEFLMITYTKAAAAELRGKIAAKLSERLAQTPDNRHLQHQMQRLYLTKISTVHAFCADILREYAYMLDIPADFRVADENECRELRDRTVERLLDSAYDNAENDPDFRAFVDAQALGRDDRLVSEILLKVYDAARCHLDPQKWLDACISNTLAEDVTDAAQTIWGEYLVKDLFSYLDLQIGAMKACADAASKAEGMEKPAALLNDTVYQLESLRAATTWDEIVKRKSIDYGRLTFSKKCPDQELAERIKAVRSACKKGLEKRLKSFADESAQVLADVFETAASVRGIVALVRRFGREYDRAKRARRILDFGDLEHNCLDLLLGKRRSGPTAAAQEIGSRFREIMVDEYQDSNAVQDAIFTALTAKRQNCFMVGDVKQSIYQFRLADPGIFLEKYASYAPAEDAKPGEGRKVMLSCNFRSGGDGLKSVKDVFAYCMSENVGGLVYGEEEALREGIPHQPLGEPEVELWTIPVEETTYTEEASFVAQRIQQLLDGTHFVRQGDQLRPIQPEDIAILLRSPGSVGMHFQRALQDLGIRCITGGGEDLLQTEEVAVLRAILQTVSNPRQDIPLLAALVSPIFGFTADDLASFRAKNRRCCIYDALVQSDTPKAQAFLEILQILRREARMRTLAQLIEKIFLLTRMDSIYAAMDGGEAKRSNLHTFYTLACDFENSARRDLEQFLEHLTAMEDKGLIAAGEQTATGAVTLMSIHKSKGLEFPVVFVCGLSREFNRESARAHVLCDQNLGLGLSFVDTRNRVRYPTVAKRAITVKTVADSLSEELRVLYVALTRARDRLIMTYASQTLEKDLQEIVSRMDMSNPELLTADVVCPGEWVLMTALRRTEAGELFALGGRPLQTLPGDPAWKIKVTSAPNAIAAVQETAEESVSLPDDVIEKLQQSLEFSYPHPAATVSPSKQTATGRKGRDKDAEAAEDAPAVEKIPVSWRKPSVGRNTGKEIGNAVHALMQHIRFDVCSDEEAVVRELDRLIADGFLTEEQAKWIDPKKIAAFFASQLGQRLRCATTVIREFKFSILDDGIRYDPALEGEKVLLQGVVDCAMIEDDGITVIDFKTDYVTQDTIGNRAHHYAPQVQAYAQALERIYQKPVKEAVLYFFHLNRFVTVI
ncbi:MAG: helicase-exonuclease AddAB subunit AddA [Oscillospiraceae bacterium]|nr:helicase-exonuclease AddAB subunit AddA [Oscillospiraceae bacterium]